METISAPIGSLVPAAPPTEWYCGCGTINILKRTSCKQCGLKQPTNSDGNSTWVKNSKIFKAGDWKCSNCNNINWDWRDSCNVCGTLKPEVALQVAKKREFERALRRPEEGAGGGFFDRQDPADKKEHNSDEEEVDDFGRKKKKKRVGAQASKPQPGLDRQRTSSAPSRGPAGATGRSRSRSQHRRQR